jgi:hypothetical protein
VPDRATAPVPPPPKKNTQAKLVREHFLRQPAGVEASPADGPAGEKGAVVARLVVGDTSLCEDVVRGRGGGGARCFFPCATIFEGVCVLCVCVCCVCVCCVCVCCVGCECCV